MQSRTNMPTYHLYDVSDNAFENFSKNRIDVCGAGHGVLCFESAEKNSIRIMRPNDEDDEDAIPKLESQIVYSINVAKKSSSVLIGLAPGQNCPVKNFVFQISNTQTKKEEAKVEISNLTFTEEEKNDFLVFNSPNLDRFGFRRSPYELWMYFYPYVSKKELKPTIFKTESKITNVFITNGELPGESNLYIIQEDKTTIYYKDPESFKEYTKRVDLDAGCPAKCATIAYSNNGDEVLILCNDNVLTFWDKEGSREFNKEEQRSPNDDDDDSSYDSHSEEEDNRQSDADTEVDIDDDSSETFSSDEENNNFTSSSSRKKEKKKKSNSDQSKKKKDQKEELELQKQLEERKRFVLDGSPKSIYWMNHSLLAIYDLFNEKTEGTIRIYNFEPPCIFGKANNGNTVKTVFWEWNSIVLIKYPEENPETLVLTNITKMAEVDMDEKIQQIIKNEQFSVALAIAKSHGMKPDQIADIHRKRGDSYHSKHQYHEAIKAYVKTIKYLEPSYVITRFIDPQQAEYLIEYLEALMKKGVANKQHTTLLFNCYTKLQKTDKLKEMVDKNCKEAEQGRLAAPFDVDTAVSVLALNGFRKEALRLAKSYKRHMSYTRMLAEDHRYKEVFDHIKTLGPKDLTQVAQTHGIDIMKAFATEREWKPFVQYIADCCSKGAPLDKKYREYVEDESTRLPKPEDFIRVFILNPEALMMFMKQVVDGLDEDGNPASDEIWNTAIESGVVALFDQDQRDWFDKYYTDGRANFNIEQLMLFLKSEGFVPGIKKLFLHPDVCFYEEVIQLTPVTELPSLFRITEPVEIWRKKNELWRCALKRLVAVCFQARAAQKHPELEQAEDAIKEMLQLLTDQYVRADEKASGFYYKEDYLLDSIENVQQVVKKDSSISQSTLNLMSGKALPPNLVEVSPVQQDNISGPIPFLEVLNILSLDKKLKLRFVKELAKTEFVIKQNRIKKLQQIEKETEKALVEKDTLAKRLVQCHYKAKTTRCTKCNGVIDLPAKHFLCGHSYHMEHLGENINMCLECEAKQKAILERKKRALKAALKRYKKPENTIVSATNDPAFVLASMLETDIMNPLQLEEELKQVKEYLKEYQT